MSNYKREEKYNLNDIKYNKIQYNPDYNILVEEILKNNGSLITGPPGTGKSYIVNLLK
jgi:DNA replication protein DnaC